MGRARATRLKPGRLPEKLLLIRNSLGLSQSELLLRLGLEDELWYTQISGYELGRSVPPPIVLLEYARLANVYVDALIDDALDLPDRLPSPAKSEGVRSKSATRAASKKRR